MYTQSSGCCGRRLAAGAKSAPQGRWFHRARAAPARTLWNIPPAHRGRAAIGPAIAPARSESARRPARARRHATHNEGLSTLRASARASRVGRAPPAGAGSARAACRRAPPQPAPPQSPGAAGRAREAASGAPRATPRPPERRSHLGARQRGRQLQVLLRRGARLSARRSRRGEGAAGGARRCRCSARGRLQHCFGNTAGARRKVQHTAPCRLGRRSASSAPLLRATPWVGPPRRVGAEGTKTQRASS